jgi:undecaprenyl-diphosphatase
MLWLVSQPSEQTLIVILSPASLAPQMTTPRIAPLLTIEQQLSIATACAVLGAALGWTVGERATAIDHIARRVARRATQTRAAMAPLFVLGLPGAYIPIAYATALWVQGRRRRGGPAIVAAAWLGWLAHRAAKVVFVRVRPSTDGWRTDSYPSGHTMGVTALAAVIGHVVWREGLFSQRASLTLAAAVSVAMGAHRVLADDHWITDVVGGWLFGAAIGGLVSAVSDVGSD